MAEEDENKSNTYIGIMHNEVMKSSTGISGEEQDDDNYEKYQYLDPNRRNGTHDSTHGEMSNNNRGILVIEFITRHIMKKCYIDLTNNNYYIIDNLLTGFNSNRLTSSNDSSLVDERKQKVVASPDSTTVTSGDRHSHQNGRSSFNTGKSKNKLSL